MAAAAAATTLFVAVVTLVGPAYAAFLADANYDWRGHWGAGTGRRTMTPHAGMEAPTEMDMDGQLTAVPIVSLDLPNLAAVTWPRLPTCAPTADPILP